MEKFTTIATELAALEKVRVNDTMKIIEEWTEKAIHFDALDDVR